MWDPWPDWKLYTAVPPEVLNFKLQKSSASLQQNNTKYRVRNVSKVIIRKFGLRVHINDPIQTYVVFKEVTQCPLSMWLLWTSVKMKFTCQRTQDTVVILPNVCWISWHQSWGWWVFLWMPLCCEYFYIFSCLCWCVGKSLKFRNIIAVGACHTKLTDRQKPWGQRLIQWKLMLDGGSNKKHTFSLKCLKQD